VLFIKHQNSISQMAQGPFSLHFGLVKAASLGPKSN
jgi:hypothetical protein